MGASDLKTVQDKPYNAEPRSLAALTKQGITPLSLVYARNHSDIVDVDADKYTVKIDSKIDDFNIEETIISFNDLRDTYEKKEVVAILVCAGNRRAKMAQKTGKDVSGVNWGEGTAANVRWGGMLLRELLLKVGVPDNRKSWEGLHVQFGSSIASCLPDATWYGGSIPLERAMGEKNDVLLAYEMNGEPLPAGHGFPVRVVVPGVSGMRWVKWLDHITISREESPNFYQQFDYKILPPNVLNKNQAKSEWSQVPSMQNIGCNSVITNVKRLPLASPDEIRLKATGYAYSDCPISSVKISADGGKRFEEASITYQEGQWSWALWEAEINVELDEDYLNAVLAGLELSEDDLREDTVRRRPKVTVMSLATDSEGHKQAETFPWNLRGVGYAGAGEFTLKV